MKNLRHSSLTMAVESGVPLKAVADRAGHSNSRITERYYLRPGKSMDESAAEAINDTMVKNVPKRAEKRLIARF